MDRDHAHLEQSLDVIEAPPVRPIHSNGNCALGCEERVEDDMKYSRKQAGWYRRFVVLCTSTNEVIDKVIHGMNASEFLQNPPCGTRGVSSKPVSDKGIHVKRISDVTA